MVPRPLFDNPRCAVRAVCVPRNKAAEVAARTDIGKATAAGRARIGVQNDLLPGFYRFAAFNRQRIHGVLQRADLFVERIDLLEQAFGVAGLGRVLRVRFGADGRNGKRVASAGYEN